MSLRKTRYRYLRDKAAMQRLRDEAEKAKIETLNCARVDVNLPFLTADADGPKHFEHKLTRAKTGKPGRRTG